MNRHNILFITIISLGIFSCKGNPSSNDKDELAALYTDVIAVHDEVMPKMGEMNSLKNQLTQRADSLLADSLKANDELALPLQSAAKELGLADEAMMQWMRDFEKPDESIDHQKATEYLQQEFEAISKVRDISFEAIEEAKDLLE